MTAQTPILFASLAQNESRMLEHYGELMDSKALVVFFKFGSARAFRGSIARGDLPVSVFRLPGRRGWFARTRDVAQWLTEAGQTEPLPSPLTRPVRS